MKFENYIKSYKDGGGIVLKEYTSEILLNYRLSDNIEDFKKYIDNEIDYIIRKYNDTYRYLSFDFNHNELNTNFMLNKFRYEYLTMLELLYNIKNVWLKRGSA